MRLTYLFSDIPRYSMLAVWRGALEVAGRDFCDLVGEIPERVFDEALAVGLPYEKEARCEQQDL